LDGHQNKELADIKLRQFTNTLMRVSWRSCKVIYS